MTFTIEKKYTTFHFNLWAHKFWTLVSSFLRSIPSSFCILLWLPRDFSMLYTTHLNIYICPNSQWYFHSSVINLKNEMFLCNLKFSKHVLIPFNLKSVYSFHQNQECELFFLKIKWFEFYINQSCLTLNEKKIIGMRIS